MLELKNGSTMRKAQCPRPIKESTNQHEIQVINRSLNILKHVCSIPSMQTTSSTPTPNSIHRNNVWNLMSSLIYILQFCLYCI